MGLTREYETLYILAPELNEEEQAEAMAAVVAVIEKAGGKIIKNDLWGRRKLAYPIKKKEEGCYVLLRFESPPEVPLELRTYVRRTPIILRHLTTVVTKHQFKEEARLREAAEKKAEEARKAAAEAEKRAAEEAAEAEAAASEPEAPAAETAPETAAEPAAVASEETTEPTAGA